jgi:hypothetical protein
MAQGIKGDSFITVHRHPHGTISVAVFPSPYSGYAAPQIISFLLQIRK